MCNQDHLDELLAVSNPVLKKVHPILADRVRTLICIAANNGLYFGAFMGLRTWEEQDELYSQGRTKPGKKVTNAPGGSSWHNFGLAVDLVEDGDPNKAGVQWSWSNNADYLKLGLITKDCGLEWGGFWKSFKDYPHVQLTADKTLEWARFRYRRNGLTDIWEAVTEFYEPKPNRST